MNTRMVALAGIPTGQDGKLVWRRIGMAFPAKKSPGYDVVLDLLPLTDAKGQIRIYIREESEAQGNQRHGGGPQPMRRPPPAAGGRGGDDGWPRSAKTDLDDEIPF